MDPFSPQEPDEGYSEDPLNPSTIPESFIYKPRASRFLRPRPPLELSPLVSQVMRHITSLSIDTKHEIVAAILEDLPTTIVADIVKSVNPRLYIDFVELLPPEVCVTILGYLDPVSLISMARSCQRWYNLAMDRRLWKNLYHLEGWQSVAPEISKWEERANRMRPWEDRDPDSIMVDADHPITQEPDSAEGAVSLFGGSGLASSSMTPGIGNLYVGDSTSSGGTEDTGTSGTGTDRKGKRKAESPPSPRPEFAQPDFTKNRPPPRTSYFGDVSSPAEISAASTNGLPRSTLWIRDHASTTRRVNWKYLYSMRQRLESNWELGRFTNFQFPHPKHLDEGHGECIYSIQFNAQYLVSGSRDRTLRVWDMKSRRLVRAPLTGHRGSVLCLQFDSDPDEDIIVSGSSDSDVIVWKFSTGQILQRLNKAHRESVLNVKFDKRILVTCSKDKTIKIFNRRDLRAGDVGYGEVVNPVPTKLKNYGYDALDTLPIKPAFSLIGSLEGHGAAVNAVQIWKDEVVSASGDRNVKVWHWPTQACVRTLVGHHKGIACVQFDGRRIVSGSSDNEVKVFDRHSGVEVASLRSHSNLVRTVQSGFGDLPDSQLEDAEEAARVDGEYFRAVEAGTLPAAAPKRGRDQARNPGSKRPEDIMAYGAKLPPGGGGGKYGRIVSGSYDTTIIIWRRDKEGIWKDQHHLKQEEATTAAAHELTIDEVAHLPRLRSRATAAAPAPAPATQPTSPPATPAQTQTSASATDAAPLPPGTDLGQLINQTVPQGVHALQQALTQHPAMLRLQPELQAAIDNETSPFVRSQLRQAVSTALVRTQLLQARTNRNRALATLDSVLAGPSNAAAQGSGAAAGSSTQQQASGAAQGQTQTQTQTQIQTQTQTQAQTQAAPAPAAVAPAPAVAGPPPPAVAPHNNAPAARQLQFDAHRIICCSQTTTIVGWDFCNGDPELEEVSRFFGTII